MLAESGRWLPCCRRLRADRLAGEHNQDLGRERGQKVLDGDDRDLVIFVEIQKMVIARDDVGGFGDLGTPDKDIVIRVSQDDGNAGWYFKHGCYAHSITNQLRRSETELVEPWLQFFVR